MIGSELSVYSDEYAAAFKESFGLLDQSGLIGRDELRHAFEEIDEERGTARAFVASLARHLRETAAVEHLPRRSAGSSFRALGTLAHDRGRGDIRIDRR